MSFAFTPTKVPDENVSIQPGIGGALPPRSFGEGMGLMQLALTAIFIFCVAIVIFLLGYRYHINSKIETKKQQLAELEVNLGKLPLKDFRVLSNSLKLANKIIKSHTSVNGVFRILEDSVEDKVTYKQFDFDYSESVSGYVIKLGAIATDYHAIINQVNTLKQKPYNKYIKSVKSENIHPDSSGGITFSLTMPFSIKGLLPEDLVLLKSGTDQLDSASSTSTNQIPGNSASVIKNP